MAQIKQMAHNYNKIILQLMIKNESKIIERCLGRCLEYVDAISILDTGSTDNTIEVCKKYLNKVGKPYKISVEPFKNFGYNRTISFQKAKELCKELKYNPDTTYTLAIDADMVICPSKSFKDYKLTANGYCLLQHNGSIKYYNIRLMKCSYDWKCIGATHEYWSGEPKENIPSEIFYINDINDGGCKADKFERDIRLLKQELKKEPNNPRTHFYLAQSYRDLDKNEEAIKMYKKRIELGGWTEEVWYSYYQIGRCYLKLNNIEKMEMWLNKAFSYYPKRAETLYQLTKYFRAVGEHYKAYHYYLKGKDIPYPKDDILFIEHNVYEGLFEYENTILAYYINKGKGKKDSLYDVINYINKGYNHSIDNVWDNIYYYVDTLTDTFNNVKYTELKVDKEGIYIPSSCSIIRYDDKLLMNIRCVNYTITPTGVYNIHSDDKVVRTINKMVYLDDNYKFISDIILMNEDMKEVFPSNIEGLEDIRLFYHNEKLMCSASSKNITKEGNITIAIGDYITEKNNIENIRVIQSPKNSSCEKNWVYLPNECSLAKKDHINFIYNWYPMEIGSVEIDSNNKNKLEIHTRFNTPKFFSRFRGSSSLVEYNDKYYCIVHFVRYTTPRVYYHCIVVLNKHTLQPEKYSIPFCFKKKEIEYCLGLDIKEKEATIFFSQNDSNPASIQVELDKIDFITI